jgi:hypothetical protein
MLNIASNLIEIGGFCFDAIFKLENEDDPILEKDQIGASATGPWQLELEDQYEFGRCRHTPLQFLSEDAPALVPSG